jgi:hypothetical protein
MNVNVKARALLSKNHHRQKNRNLSILLRTSSELETSPEKCLEKLYLREGSFFFLGEPKMLASAV